MFWVFFLLAIFFGLKSIANQKKIGELNEAKFVLIKSRGCQIIEQYTQLKVVPSDSIKKFDNGECALSQFEFKHGDSDFYQLKIRQSDSAILLNKEDIISYSN